MTILAVVGSREFNDYAFLEYYMDMFFYIHGISEIVSGGARGADSLAQKWADLRNIKIKIFLPDWNLNGKKAGFLRNIEIVNNCDVLMAFWDGKSKGTEHSINLARKEGKKVIVYYTNRSVK